MKIAIVGGGHRRASASRWRCTGGAGLRRLRSGARGARDRRRHHAAAARDARAGRAGRAAAAGSRGHREPAKACSSTASASSSTASRAAAHAGYALPEIGIHRGKLHRDPVRRRRCERLGAQRVHLDHRCAGVDAGRAAASRAASTTRVGRRCRRCRRTCVVACDGVNSAVRRQFYPDEQLAFGGINTWRGVTVHEPILTGKSYLRIGSIETGKMVIYPIVDNVDGAGQPAGQLGGRDPARRRAMNDWNQPGRLEDFVGHLRGLALRLARRAGADPRRRADLRVPDGGQGSGAALDLRARDVAGRRGAPDVPARLQRLGPGHHRRARRWRTSWPCEGDGPGGPAAYEAAAGGHRARSCDTNRTVPPDFINIKVDELSGGKPFAHIDDLISQEELRRMSERLQEDRGLRAGSRAGRSAAVSVGAGQAAVLSSGTAACASAESSSAGAVLHRQPAQREGLAPLRRGSAWSSRCIRPCISLGSISIWKLRGFSRLGRALVETQPQRPLASGEASTSVTSSGSSPRGSCGLVLLVGRVEVGVLQELFLAEVGQHLLQALVGARPARRRRLPASAGARSAACSAAATGPPSGGASATGAFPRLPSVLTRIRMRSCSGR